eukprot:scaffold5937_cov68-Phaeocystis_antarctica.AAC.11
MATPPAAQRRATRRLRARSPSAPCRTRRGEGRRRSSRGPAPAPPPARWSGRPARVGSHDAATSQPVPGHARRVVAAEQVGERVHSAPLHAVADEHDVPAAQQLPRLASRAHPEAAPLPHRRRPVVHALRRKAAVAQVSQAPALGRRRTARCGVGPHGSSDNSCGSARRQTCCRGVDADRSLHITASQQDNLACLFDYHKLAVASSASDAGAQRKGRLDPC